MASTYEGNYNPGVLNSGLKYKVSDISTDGASTNDVITFDGVEATWGAGGGGGGVSSFNTLTGAVVLAAGSNITLTPVGNTITIASTAGAPSNPVNSIQFNNSGAFGGDANFTFDPTDETVLLTATDIFIPSAGSVVFGAGAGNHTMSGTDNILIGGKDDGFANVGLSLTTGDENVFIGKGTGRLMAAAARNVIIGSGAGSGTGAAGTVSDNVVIGRGTGSALGLASGTASGNVLIGQGTGTTINASYNVAIGYQAMGFSTGTGNIAIGFSALSATTSGINIGIGDSVGQNITSGTGNILIGSIAGNGLLVGSQHNTMIGYQSGSLAEGNFNTFYGSQAGVNNQANDNTFIGYLAGNSQHVGVDVNATRGTAVGSKAFPTLEDGAHDNAGLGYFVGQTLTTGTQNTLVGSEADVSVAATNNAIALGYKAIAGSNQFVVGSDDAPISTIFFGNGRTNGTPQDITINATAAAGTDVAGADLTIISGTSTGTGIGGDVIIQTSPAGGAGTGVNSPLEVILFDGNGNIRAARVHNNTTAQGTANEQDIRSGTYTPTLTAVTNVASSTPRKAQWLRVGNVVTVSGQLDITTTTTGATALGISLPIASNFGTTFEASGTGTTPVGVPMSIYADATANRAEMAFDDTIGLADSVTYQFTYEVI